MRTVRVRAVTQGSRVMEMVHPQANSHLQQPRELRVPVGDVLVAVDDRVDDVAEGEKAPEQRGMCATCVIRCEAGDEGGA